MNRSFTARLSRKTHRRLRDYLWATHRIFNESLAYLLKHYFWMQNLTDRELEQDKKNRLRQRFDAAQLDQLQLIYRDMMGLDLPKEKRAGRSQSAQAWMEPITFSTRSTGKGPGELSTNILPKVKVAIRTMRQQNLWVFDRELAFPIEPHNGFRRGLFGGAARRILNFEQNQETHRGYLEDAKRAYERWRGGQAREAAEDDTVDARRAGWRRTVLLRAWGEGQEPNREAEIDGIAQLQWADFQRAREEFSQYESQRAADRAREQKRPVTENAVEKINAAMTRGWRDVYQQRLMPPDADGPPDAATAGRLIKDYQAAEPTRIGDINFFLWLADKPHLWRFVDTMKAYNAHQRKLERYGRPIQFTYPRYNRRPEWFTFSETSPGHMYTIVSMTPLKVDLAVFVPNEDVPLLEKLSKGQPLTGEETRRLNEPLDWTAYRLTPERLVERRNAHRTKLTERIPDAIAKYGLDAVHAWTDGVWERLLGGFFREDPPLDMSRFTRVMVRYSLSTDVRLRPFAPEPASEEDLLGRLVVRSNDRQKPHWQGTYQYMFGPLTEPNDSLPDRRRHLRAMPMVVGGIRLEYRDCLRNDADPIFTLSCELDERVAGPEGKQVYPAPQHRIPKKAQPTEAAEEGTPQEGKKRKDAKKRPKMPVGLRVLSVDLGMRHIGTGAVVEFVDDGHGNGRLPHPLKPVGIEFLDAPGIALRHIDRHSDERRRKQRKACPRGSRRAFEIRGAHLPRGQVFARHLLDHTENLKDDRRKKAAHAILRAALKHNVDYIVFENLKGYRPDFEFGRRVNATLMKWNRRELVEFVKMEAQPFGIWVYDFVRPSHTSQFCHRCGAAGYRFSQITRREAAFDTPAPKEPLFDEHGNRKLDSNGKPLFRHRWTPQARRIRGTPLGLIAGMRQAIDGGKHFCCSECGLIVNADYNAAMNLARKLADDFSAYQKYSYNPEDKSWALSGKRMAGKTFWEHIKATVQQRLNTRFGQPVQTPPAGGWPKEFAPESIGLTPW